jgi:hypothetical protein
MEITFFFNYKNDKRTNTKILEQCEKEMKKYARYVAKMKLTILDFLTIF